MFSDYINILIETKNMAPLIFYSIIFSFSAAAATFLNVLMYRMPTIINNGFIESAKMFLESKDVDHSELNLENEKYGTLMGRSYCPSCQSLIPMWFNIPVLGWLFLRGKSNCCNTKISPRYFFIEFGFSAAVCTLFYYFDFYQALGASVFLYLAIAISDIDIKISMITDEYTYILLWIGVLFNINGTFVSIESSIYGIVAAYSSLYIINSMYSSIRGSDGMGMGDFKLISAVAAWTGLVSIPYILAMSCVTAVLLFLNKKIIRKSYSLNSDQSIPFAPSIIISGFAYLLLQF